MNEKLMRRLGWLGLVSLLSYAAAVVFSSLAYPGYDWLSQAVSDLSADSAPSRVLWNQLAALYTPCGIVCVTLCCVSVRGHFNRTVRIGTRLLQKADFDMPLLVLCYTWMAGLDADKLNPRGLGAGSHVRSDADQHGALRQFQLYHSASGLRRGGLSAGSQCTEVQD